MLFECKSLMAAGFIDSYQMNVGTSIMFTTQNIKHKVTHNVQDGIANSNSCISVCSVYTTKIKIVKM